MYVALIVGVSTKAKGYFRAATLTSLRIHVPKYSDPHASSIASLSVPNTLHISAVPLLHLRHTHLPVVPWATT